MAYLLEGEAGGEPALRAVVGDAGGPPAGGRPLIALFAVYTRAGSRRAEILIQGGNFLMIGGCGPVQPVGFVRLCPEPQRAALDDAHHRESRREAGVGGQNRSIPPLGRPFTGMH